MVGADRGPILRDAHEDPDSFAALSPFSDSAFVARGFRQLRCPGGGEPGRHDCGRASLCGLAKTRLFFRCLPHEPERPGIVFTSAGRPDRADRHAGRAVAMLFFTASYFLFFLCTLTCFYLSPVKLRKP